MNSMSESETSTFCPEVELQSFHELIKIERLLHEILINIIIFVSEQTCNRKIYSEETKPCGVSPVQVPHQNGCIYHGRCYGYSIQNEIRNQRAL